MEKKTENNEAWRAGNSELGRHHTQTDKEACVYY